MALRQNPGESIASYIRNAEKLSKRVPSELDSVLALCLIKGMTDELKKADISYIVNATPDTSFRKVVEIIKAKYRVIGEPDPFSRVAESQKSTHTGRWGAYIAPSSGNNVVPVVAAAGRMSTIPNYNVSVDHRTGNRPVEAESRAKNIYGERNLAAALEGCGISPDQLKGLVDWYLQDSVGNAEGPLNQESQTVPTGVNRQQDFQRPALPPPGVTIPAHGVNRRTGVVGTLPANQWGGANYGGASPGVSCFSCGRRGHYSMSCPYPPLPPGEQEKLREAARISRLQRAGLPIPVNHQTAVHAIRSHDQGHIIEGIAPLEPPIASGTTKQQQNEIPVETIATRAPLNNDSRISLACAILSRLPPVMTAIQDVMAGKRMRTVPASEEDVGRADRNPKMMRTREHLYDDEMGDSYYDEPGRSERQSTMERVVLQPVGEAAPPDPIPRVPGELM